MLNAWVSFLKDPIYLDDATLEIPEIKDAMDTLKYISSDDETRAIADLRKKTINDYNSELTVAREEGMEEGIEYGISFGKQQGIQKIKDAVLNMREKGLDNGFIAECLGITEVDVESYLKYPFQVGFF